MLLHSGADNEQTSLFCAKRRTRCRPHSIQRQLLPSGRRFRHQFRSKREFVVDAERLESLSRSRHEVGKSISDSSPSFLSNKADFGLTLMLASIFVSIINPLFNQSNRSCFQNKILLTSALLNFNFILIDN